MTTWSISLKINMIHVNCSRLPPLSRWFRIWICVIDLFLEKVTFRQLARLDLSFFLEMNILQVLCSRLPPLSRWFRIWICVIDFFLKKWPSRKCPSVATLTTLTRHMTIIYRSTHKSTGNLMVSAKNVKKKFLTKKTALRHWQNMFLDQNTEKECGTIIFFIKGIIALQFCVEWNYYQPISTFPMPIFRHK